MNPLAIAQLVQVAFNVINVARHPNTDHNVVEQVKTGLTQLVNFFQQQHQDQEKAKQENFSATAPATETVEKSE